MSTNSVSQVRPDARPHDADTIDPFEGWVQDEADDWPPVNPAEMNRLDEWVEGEYQRQAIADGYDPFGGQTVEEFYQTRDGWADRCGQQFPE